MPTPYIIHHHKPGLGIEVLMLALDDSVKDRCNQLRSLHYFFKRELERGYGTLERRQKVGRGEIEVTTGRPFTDLENTLWQLNPHNPPISAVPTFTSVWNLYRALGYDYKKKRYETQQRVPTASQKGGADDRPQRNATGRPAR